MKNFKTLFSIFLLSVITFGVKSQDTLTFKMHSKTTSKLISDMVVPSTAIEDMELSLLLFNRINRYRIESGLEAIKIDTSIYKAAKHHSMYMASNVESLSHRESEEQFATPPKRMSHFLNRNVIGIENVLMKTVSNPATKKEILIEYMFLQWKNSLGHNKNMLCQNISIGAVSVVKVKISYDVKSTRPNGEVKTINVPNTLIYATFNACK